MTVSNVVASVMPWTRKDHQHRDRNVDVTEDQAARRPLLEDDPTSQEPFGPAPLQSYGAAGPSSGSPSLRESPERHRRNSALDRVPEEADLLEPGEDADADEEEWDLEAQGLYSGSYTRAVAWYSLVPLTSILIFVVLAILPSFVWPYQRHSPSNNTRYFPFPLPEILVSAALWSLSHLLRDPLFTLVSKFVPDGLANAIVFNAFHVTLTQILRLAAIAVLRIRHQMDYPLPTSEDPAFHRVWWIALGWSFAEVCAGIAQGYDQLALYRNVMVPHDQVRDVLTKSRNGSSEEFLPLSPRTIRPGDNNVSVASSTVVEGNGRRHTSPQELDEVVETEVEKDVELLIEIKDREELEEIYGVPFIKIPVFVSCLQRVDLILINLGLTLVLAASYLRSPISFPDGSSSPVHSSRLLFITFPLVAFFHLIMSLLHTPPVLPRLGVPTAAYVGVMVGLGSVFAGLAFWGALS